MLSKQSLGRQFFGIELRVLAALRESSTFSLVDDTSRVSQKYALPVGLVCYGGGVSGGA